MKTCYS